MDKFQRNYILEIETFGGGSIVIRPPLTLEFDIVRDVHSSANTCTVRIINLSSTTRQKIRYDFFDFGNVRKIELKAGYGDTIPTIFTGNMSRAWSFRQGTEYITQIECYDGGTAFSNATFNDQFPEGTNFNSILDSIVGTLPGVSMGAIGDFSGTISKGASYSGNSVDIIRELTGGAFFIDNGFAYCLKDSECIEGEIQLITSASGLLGTPILEHTFLSFDMLFEPRILVCQKIELKSITESNFNGFYRVNSVKHKGIISDAIAGQAITTLGMWYGPNTLKTVSRK